LLVKYAHDPAGLAGAIAKLVKANPAEVGQIVGAVINAEKNNAAFVNANFECLVVQDSLAALKGPAGITNPAVIAGIAAVVADTVKSDSRCSCDIMKAAIADIMPTTNPPPATLAIVATFLADVVTSVPPADVAATSTCAVDAIKTTDSTGTQITNTAEITTILTTMVTDIVTSPSATATTTSAVVPAALGGAVTALVITSGNPTQNAANANLVGGMVNSVVQNAGIDQSLAVNVVAATTSAAATAGSPQAANAITTTTTPTITTLPTSLPNQPSTPPATPPTPTVPVPHPPVTGSQTQPGNT